MRRNKNALPDPKDKRIAELEQQLAEALALIQQLQKVRRQVELLQAEVEELKRAGKRQAAPFARRHWVEHPKRPGRKAGKGRFVQRAKPSLKEVSETKVAELPCCPECGGKLRQRRRHEQFEIDLPKVQPIIRRFLTYSGYCGHCRKRVQIVAPGSDLGSSRSCGDGRRGSACESLGGRPQASLGCLVRQSE